MRLAASSSALNSAANGPATRAAPGSLRGGAAAGSSSASAAATVSSTSASAESQTESPQLISDVWQEKIRLAQEALTLLRRIVTDSRLGKLLNPVTSCQSAADTRMRKHWLQHLSQCR